MKILAIDTSCDDTSVAITEGRKILTNVIFSQVKYHAEFGGVYPTVAKREHLTKINPAVKIALQRVHIAERDIDAFAVTFGPGLAPALEVGLNKAKELATTNNKPLIPVDHIEGHIYSSFAQNRNGLPIRDFKFPLLAFIISGGHTDLILMKDHVHYEILGQKLDDAAGEAFDKIARTMGLGYPGGAVIEKLARDSTLSERYKLPIPMLNHTSLDFSYSGLKTAFVRLYESIPEKELPQELAHLAQAAQSAIVTSLVLKLKKAVQQFQPKQIVFGGGVSDNKFLRKYVRQLGFGSTPVYFPTSKNLTADNAAMIGVAAFYKYQKGIICTDITHLDRMPRTHLNHFIT
ncbi:MAG: tRNA (adenosine(37)-N6)-threonylcarbamoyltransferase complex transferase subunit TsaD [Patescibacteria group bacterium]|jgi:N6-L-threonylcarbamoyladenine synthase